MGCEFEWTDSKQLGSISDKDFMIQVLNNFPEDYDKILNGLENCLTATGDYALTTDLIHKKWITGRK